jgi:hypothetical protein
MSPRDNIEDLRARYPGKPFGALWALPAGFESQPDKVAAFAETWEKGEDLARMIEARIKSLSSKFDKPFPTMAGPSFEELAQDHRSTFMSAIVKAASVDGKMSEDQMMSEFGKAIEGVRKLERSIRENNLRWEMESRGVRVARCR